MIYCVPPRRCRIQAGVNDGGAYGPIAPVSKEL
jgi:hypothetical protein